MRDSSFDLTQCLFPVESQHLQLAVGRTKQDEENVGPCIDAGVDSPLPIGSEGRGQDS